jgi:hypothetical protein
MEYVSRQAGHIQTTAFLQISPEVLGFANIRFAAAVANRRGVPLLTLDEAVDQMDFEVMYKQMDWKDPAIKERLKTARKYELLVPNDISLTLIGGM